MSEEKERFDPATEGIEDPQTEQSLEEQTAQNDTAPETKQESDGKSQAPPSAEEDPAGKPNHKKKKKKRAYVFILVLALLAVLLILLNALDFDALAEKLRGNSDDLPEMTVVTYPQEWFEIPNYSEDVTADADYMNKKRDLYYKDGSEGFGIVRNPEAHGPLCVLWYDYMNALIDGDLAKLKSLCTDDYIGKYLQMKRFAPQKIYDFEVELLETWDLKDTGDKDGNYKGYIVYYFEVSYHIKDNNGTFRRDFYDDSEAIPLRFEVLQKDNEFRINNQKPIRSLLLQPVEKGVNIMLYVWIGLILMAVISELTTTALVAVWFIPAGIVSLVLSIVMPDQIVIQIVTYVAVSALLLLLTRPLVKRHIQKGNYQPTNADMVVGKIAIVTERIDNIAQTGEVKVDGKRWTARTADGSVIEPDTLVSVLEIRGVKLICEPAPKNASVQ